MPSRHPLVHGRIRVLSNLYPGKSECRAVDVSRSPGQCRYGSRHAAGRIPALAVVVGRENSSPGLPTTSCGLDTINHRRTSERSSPDCLSAKPILLIYFGLAQMAEGVGFEAKRIDS